MARDKTASHARIVEAAAARIRAEGADHLNVASLMAEAGLTHGGFYRHFSSRDQLVDEAVSAALADGARRVSGRKTMASKIRNYLSVAHRDCPDSGCGMAALGGDVARGSAASQAAYADQLSRDLDQFSADTGDRGEAAVLLSAMVGAVVLSRASGDAPVADELLRLVRDRLINSYA